VTADFSYAVTEPPLGMLSYGGHGLVQAALAPAGAAVTVAEARFPAPAVLLPVTV